MAARAPGRRVAAHASPLKVFMPPPRRRLTAGSRIPQSCTDDLATVKAETIRLFSYERSAAQSRSSKAARMRCRWGHQTPGGSSSDCCHTGVWWPHLHRILAAFEDLESIVLPQPIEAVVGDAVGEQT